MFKTAKNSKKVFLRSNVFELKSWRGVLSSLRDFCVEQSFRDVFLQLLQLLLLLGQFGREDRYQPPEPVRIGSDLVVNLKNKISYYIDGKLFNLVNSEQSQYGFVLGRYCYIEGYLITVYSFQ